MDHEHYDPDDGAPRMRLECDTCWTAFTGFMRRQAIKHAHAGGLVYGAVSVELGQDGLIVSANVE